MGEVKITDIDLDKIYIGYDETPIPMTVYANWNEVVEMYAKLKLGIPDPVADVFITLREYATEHFGNSTWNMSDLVTHILSMETGSRFDREALSASLCELVYENLCF